MVFVKVREVYDLHTVQNKISLIAIHTPTADIIKRNYPGLLMQCKTYRPVSCDVRVACASMLPADPLQVSTTAGDIAPEDLFNPILYKACTNHGMSQIEARINGIMDQQYGISPANVEVDGSSAFVDNDTVTSLTDEFNLYYGFLSDTHSWRHASPQSGFEMTGLTPLVYERLATYGDMNPTTKLDGYLAYPDSDGNKQTVGSNSEWYIRGNAKPMPMMNCTSYSYNSADGTGAYRTGFDINSPSNCEVDVPAPQVMVGCIIVPPSRLHQLYYRMVVEWTLEFSSVRTIGEITNWSGIASIGAAQHYQSYSYASSKDAEGVEAKAMPNDTDLVSTNVDIKKVM